jgi:hypothetical protein
MSYLEARMQPVRPRRERRDDRVPLEMFLNQYVDDRLHRAVTTNVSPTGLYVNRVLGGLPRLLTRDSRFVQLEFELPGTGEIIWARGEVRRDELELDAGAEPGPIHGAGIHLVDIAQGHQQLLREWVLERKWKRLHQMFQLVKHRRYH